MPRFLYFTLPHIVVGKDIRAFTYFSVPIKRPRWYKSFFVVRNSRYHYMANPHGDLFLIEILCKLQNIPVRAARKQPVLLSSICF